MNDYRDARSEGVSAVILSLNEVSNIKRCIESLHWCREIVVVDSGSCDGTQEYAKSLGARVLVNRPNGRFLISNQRNWALNNIVFGTEWILFVDADEAIGPKCRAEIQNQISQDNAIDAYELAPRYWFMGRWLKKTQGFPCWHPRLLKKTNVRFEGGVWESFCNYTRVGRLQEPYEHYAFSKGVDDWLARHIRYADWEAERIVCFLRSNKLEDLKTTRFVRLRAFAAQVWPARPLLRFLQKYLMQGGISEGWQGLLFCLMMAMYELITVAKVIEILRKEDGLSL